MTYFNNNSLFVTNTDQHCIIALDLLTMSDPGGPAGSCGDPGSAYCCTIDSLKMTSPAGIQYSSDTNMLYYTSLVHAGIFSMDLNDYSTSIWQQTVAQCNSLHIAISADTLLVGVEFGIMTIDTETAEAQWFAGGTAPGDYIGDDLSTKFSQVADFTSLSDEAVVISDKVLNRYIIEYS